MLYYWYTYKIIDSETSHYTIDIGDLNVYVNNSQIKKHHANFDDAHNASRGELTTQPHTNTVPTFSRESVDFDSGCH